MELVEGRRYKDEPTPINESLERHYQDRIKELENKLEEAKAENNRLDMELERMDIRIKVLNKKVDAFRTSTAEITAKYIMLGGEF